MDIVDNTFSVETKPFSNGIVFEMQGELSKQAEGLMLKLIIYDEMLEESQGNLIFNFTNVTYINSAGISILIRVMKPAIKKEYNIFAYGITSLQQKLFRAVGLTEYMMVYPDEYSILQRIENIKS